MQRQPDEKDYIKDYMIAEFEKEFADKIDNVQLSESLGNGKITIGRNSASVSIVGGDEGYYKGEKIELLAGREIGDKAQKGGKAVCLLSDYAADKLFKDSSYEKAVGKKVQVISGRTFYDFTIVGVYKLDEQGMLFASLTTLSRVMDSSTASVKDGVMTTPFLTMKKQLPGPSETFPYSLRKRQVSYPFRSASRCP